MIIVLDLLTLSVVGTQYAKVQDVPKGILEKELTDTKYKHVFQELGLVDEDYIPDLAHLGHSGRVLMLQRKVCILQHAMQILSSQEYCPADDHSRGVMAALCGRLQDAKSRQIIFPCFNLYLQSLSSSGEEVFYQL